MSKIIRRHRFLDIWRIGETESWLTDMAAEGLRLKKFGPIFSRFESVEPESVRYRIEFANDEYWVGDEQLELYAQSRWEYVCDWGEARVFRSPEEANAPEIHTDPAEQAVTLRRLKRRYTRAVIGQLLYVVMAACMTGLMIHFRWTPTLELIEGRLLGFLLLILMYFFSIFESSRAALSIRKLIRSMREGRAIDHRAPWRAYKGFRSVISTLFTLALVASLFMIAVIQVKQPKAQSLPLISNEPMLLRLADIEQEPKLARRVSMYNGEDVANRIWRDRTPLAPVLIRLDESGIISDRYWAASGGAYKPSLKWRIFELAIPQTADGLMADLAREIESRNERRGNSYPMEEIAMPGIDRMLTRESGDILEVFARRGNIVAYAQYNGMRDMDTVAEAVAEKLRQSGE